MTKQDLQYFLHDEPDAFRLELSGSLSGEPSQSVYQAWRTALSIIGDRQVIVDITFVTDADERGEALLLLWRRHGVQIIAASAESWALAESILGEPMPRPPEKLGLFARVRAMVQGRGPARAGIPARAERRQRLSATTREGRAEFTAVAHTGRLE